jgi:hypothetical protein
METLLRIVLIILGVIVGLVVLIGIGLQVQPASFPPFPQKSGEIRTVPLPSGLPAPVERFYRKIYGDKVPVIESAVITGKVTVRPVGPVAFPGRFRITHLAGQAYRHYIEAGLFAIPMFQVNERYVDGKSLFESPFGTTDNDPKVNQGANLGLWSESVWLPSIFITDLRVHWEPIDDQTALLVVPFEATQEKYVVRFDPQTSLITYFESMRYHAAESQAKTLWLNQSVEWGTINGQPLMKVGAAIWMDDGKPWAVFTVEDVVYNVDVKDYLLAKGQ